jgi:hypothetical protein
LFNHGLVPERLADNAKRRIGAKADSTRQCRGTATRQTAQVENQKTVQKPP